MIFRVALDAVVVIGGLVLAACLIWNVREYQRKGK